MNKMINDTDTQEKTAHRAVQSVKYFFVCSCGCGQMSEELGKLYFRLRKGQKWVAKSCLDNREIVTEIVNGYIINESDF